MLLRRRQQYRGPTSSLLPNRHDPARRRLGANGSIVGMIAGRDLLTRPDRTLDLASTDVSLTDSSNMGRGATSQAVPRSEQAPAGGDWLLSCPRSGILRMGLAFCLALRSASAPAMAWSRLPRGLLRPRIGSGRPLFERARARDLWRGRLCEPCTWTGMGRAPSARPYLARLDKASRIPREGSPAQCPLHCRPMCWLVPRC
jgi:hypothetical protein